MSISVTLSVNGVERMEMLSVPRDADMRWLAHTVKEIAGVPEHLQRVSVVVRSLTILSVFFYYGDVCTVFKSDYLLSQFQRTKIHAQIHVICLGFKRKNGNQRAETSRLY